jgi:hypothetical protein
MMFRASLFSLFFMSCLSTNSALAQASPVDLGFEFQAYPTGLIPGLRIEKGIGRKHAVNLRFGYNWIRHGDAGKHDDERGDGFGGSVGFRHYFTEGQKHLFLGLRSDVWFNQIDWQDSSPQRQGATKITVLQPTLEGGYLFLFGSGDWSFTPSIATGFEVNVKTEGEETGQGLILLGGISIGKRF